MYRKYTEYILREGIVKSQAYLCLALKGTVKQVSKWKVEICFEKLSISVKVEHNHCNLANPLGFKYAPEDRHENVYRNAIQISLSYKESKCQLS